MIERFQENSTLQRKYGRPPHPEDATQEILSSPSAVTIDEKTKNSIRRRRQEMVAFANQVSFVVVGLCYVKNNFCLLLFGISG